MLNDGLVALDGGKGVQPAEHIRQMAERTFELLVGLVAHLGERAECGDIGKEANAVHLADVVVQRRSGEDHFRGAPRLAHRQAERVCHVVRRAHRDVPELERRYGGMIYRMLTMQQGSDSERQTHSGDPDFI